MLLLLAPLQVSRNLLGLCASLPLSGPQWMRCGEGVGVDRKVARIPGWWGEDSLGHGTYVPQEMRSGWVRYRIVEINVAFVQASSTNITEAGKGGGKMRTTTVPTQPRTS